MSDDTLVNEVSDDTVVTVVSDDTLVTVVSDDTLVNAVSGRAPVGRHTEVLASGLHRRLGKCYSYSW